MLNLLLLTDYLDMSFGISQFYTVLGILGATTIGIIIEILLENQELGRHVTVFVFLFISTFLLIKTFRKSLVRLVYPLTLVGMSFISLVILIMFSVL